MIVEIGALVEKNIGHTIIENVKDIDGIVTAFLESGRSDDLFEEKQFGEFGESAVLTVLASGENKEEILEKIFFAAELDKHDLGIIFSNNKIIRSSID